MKINKKQKIDQMLKISLFALAFVTMSSGAVYAYAYGGGQGFQELSDLTDEQKAIFEKIREFRQEGDFEGAHEMMENSGIEKPMFARNKFVSYVKNMNKQDDVKEAIENNDYETFLELRKDSPMADKITPEIFEKIVEAHTLREEGDYEGAREIFEEIGFGSGIKGRGMGQGIGGGMHRGR